MTGPKFVRVPFEDLQHIFDIATGSMDFGSGFLDNEQVDVLRRIAAHLRVNPMVATPSNFNQQYKHAYEPATNAPDRCRWCWHPEESAWHGDPTERSGES